MEDFRQIIILNNITKRRSNKAMRNPFWLNAIRINPSPSSHINVKYSDWEFTIRFSKN